MFVIIIIIMLTTELSSVVQTRKRKNSSKTLLVLRDSLVELAVVHHLAASAASLLLDLDPPLGWGLGLRDDDGKDTILQRSLDGILIDALREREGARKRADGSLRNPVAGLVSVSLLVLGNLLRCGSFGWCGRGNGGRVFVFDSGLVGLVRAGCAFGLSLGGIGQLLLLLSGLGFKEGGWAATLFSDSLGATADREGGSVGELDVDVLLGDAWEFAVQLVRILVLLHVEARLETADSLREGWAASEAAVDKASIVVHQAEQAVLAPECRGEVVVDEAWEECHFAWCGESWNRVVGGLEGLLSVRVLIVDALFLF
jgi:hypothetical protein